MCKGTWTLNPKTGLVDVDGDFRCYSQGLSDFKGVKFGVVNGGFDCDNNRLTSLVGAPHSVGGSFFCSNNHLTSLVGAPHSVGGSFWCKSNRLTSLEGAPQEVERLLYLEDLGPLFRAPRTLGRDFWFHGNPVSEKTLNAIFDKMQKGVSFWSAAASLRKEMSRKDWKLITTHIPEDIQPGVNMLARFGVFK